MNRTLAASEPEGLLPMVESPDLTTLQCLALMVEHADQVGLQFYLCQRLRAFPFENIGFFLPQLVQILVAVETESAALEDFVLELCNRSTHYTLVVFWLLQAALGDLGDEPQSPEFAVAKRMYNKLQYILFALGEPPSDQMRENTQPALVLIGMVASAMVPAAGRTLRPLVVSQGRRQRSYIIRLATKARRIVSSASAKRAAQANEAALTAETAGEEPYEAGDHAESLEAKADDAAADWPHQNPLSSKSMPDLSELAIKPSYAQAKQRMSGDITRMPAAHRLKTHYFRCEAQFMYALQNIAFRLLQMPREARLSALQLELALLNRDLPAEVDLPMLLPVAGNRQCRIVRIAPSEAAVLNSAEKAPYLLLVEYLRGDLSFDPETKRNKHLLSSEGPPRYLFDRTPNASQSTDVSVPTVDQSIAVEEQDLSGISVSKLNSIDPRMTVGLDPKLRSESMPELRHELENDSGLTRGKGRPLRLHATHLHVGNKNAKVPLSPAELDAVAHMETVNPGDVGAARSTAAATEPSPSISDLATQMRTASIILAQLDGREGAKLPKSDIAAIKARVIANMQAFQDHHVLISGEAGERRLENDLKTAGLASSDDPSAANLGEDWRSRKARIRQSSPYGNYPDWDLFSVIVKTGDDLRQEAFACQLIALAAQIWDDEGVPVWVRRMRILITSGNSGLVETITNGLSIHSIKKALTAVRARSAEADGGTASSSSSIAQLDHHFEQKFGARGTPRHRRAVRDFTRSLAAYSLLTYLLQIKDRHNGNILLDSDGHIIHIDFGFMLSNTPGGHFDFENSPFKFTYEYLDVMGGMDSPAYSEFVSLLKQAFLALRRHADEFVTMADIMVRRSKLPCFASGSATTRLLKQRFMLSLSDEDAEAFVERDLVGRSLGSKYTRLYDQFQMVTQGIYS